MLTAARAKATPPAVPRPPRHRPCRADPSPLLEGRVAPKILPQPLERGPRGRTQRDPSAASGATWSLDASSPLQAVPMSTKRRLEEVQETLHKQFLSEENMATHFSQLRLHNHHPYCSPLRALPPVLPPLRSPCSELHLWCYSGNLIPEALRLLRLGDTPSPTTLLPQLGT